MSRMHGKRLVHSLSEAVLQIAGSWTRRQVFATGQALPTGHVFVCRGAEKVPNDVELVAVAFARKNGLAHEHLSKYAAAFC